MVEYKVHNNFKGCEVVVSKTPPFIREQGKIFDLNKCTQDDLRWLYEVLGFTRYIYIVKTAKASKE